MRSWLSQTLSTSSTPHSSRPLPKKDDRDSTPPKAKESSSARPTASRAPSSPSTSQRRIPPPPQSQKQRPPPLVSRSRMPTVTPASSVAGPAAKEASSISKQPQPRPHRLPLSPITAAAAAATASRRVHFDLPPTPTTPSGAVPLPQDRKGIPTPRGPEYVTVTRATARPQPSPVPSPVRIQFEATVPPVGSVGAYAYQIYADAPKRTSSVLADVDFGHTVKTGPAIYAKRIGPFKFLRTLNGGTFGDTYVAHDQGSGRVVCARVFKKARLSAEERIKHGLLVEAHCYKLIAASAARDRAHLMELHGILQDEGRVLFVMPLMQYDLLDALGAAPEGRLDRAFVRRWTAQLALGIDALHRMGIIHRDIKPENVLLDGPEGNARIADFNAALVVNGGRPVEDGEVYSQDMVGSVPYIAWETARRQWYGKMVDWWALGCVMYDLLTNSVLFCNGKARECYANWDRKCEGMSYLEWKGDLQDEEESVIAGLIDLHPWSRFQLRHLRRHTYFCDENRVNVFDVLLREPAEDLLSVGRAAHPSLLQVEARLEKVALCHAGPRPPKVRTAAARAAAVPDWRLGLSSDTQTETGMGTGAETGTRAGLDAADAHDFSGFGWVNPRGLWKAYSC